MDNEKDMPREYPQSDPPQTPPGKSRDQEQTLVFDKEAPPELSPADGSRQAPSEQRDGKQEDFTLVENEDFTFTPPQTPPEVPKKEKRRARKKREKRKRRRLWVLIFVIVILLVSFLLAAGILVAANDFLALMKEDREVLVEIDKGANTEQIAKTLEENGIIQFGLLFRAYVSINDEGGDFQYGLHPLNANMSYEQLVLELKKDAKKLDVVSVVIPEGKNLTEIASLLKESKIIEDEKDFLDYFNRNDIGFEIEKQIPREALRFNRKEGYAFPDTYDFYIGEEYDSIISRFLSNFEERTQSLEAEIAQGMEKYGLTYDQVITLASVIQAESSDEATMNAVAGIFHNRLKNPVAFPRLQSDPTTEYAENVIKKYATAVDQKMLDAYNTYVCTGLPIGPICNPGVAAIRAAVNPEQSDYFYFVTDKSGNFYYGKTLAEHNANCRKAGISVS